MRHLGIDYGTKRIGIAMSDEDGAMAFPKEVLKNDKDLIENLRKIIDKNLIKRVVIGESKNYKMKDNEIMKEILDFQSVIEKVFEIDAVLQPEFMTSMQAEYFQGKTEMTDASAATIILQAYLDSVKNKK